MRAGNNRDNILTLPSWLWKVIITSHDVPNWHINGPLTTVESNQSQTRFVYNLMACAVASRQQLAGRRFRSGGICRGVLSPRAIHEMQFGHRSQWSRLKLINGYCISSSNESYHFGAYDLPGWITSENTCITSSANRAMSRKWRKVGWSPEGKQAFPEAMQAYSEVNQAGGS